MSFYILTAPDGAPIGATAFGYPVVRVDGQRAVVDIGMEPKHRLLTEPAYAAGWDVTILVVDKADLAAALDLDTPDADAAARLRTVLS